MSPLSDQKLQANRANSAQSTGPKTEAGKAASAQNARKHGLSASTLWIPAELMPEYLSLFNTLLREIRPIGELQQQFFEQLVHASWQQQIARNFLAQAQRDGDERRMALHHRYLRQYERSFAAALKEIKALQTDLALRTAAQNEPTILLPTSYDVKTIARQATAIAQLSERSQRPHIRRAVLHKICATITGHPSLNTPPAPNTNETAQAA